MLTNASFTSSQSKHHCAHLAKLLIVPSCGSAREFHPIVNAHAAHFLKKDRLLRSFFKSTGFSALCCQFHQLQGNFKRFLKSTYR